MAKGQKTKTKAAAKTKAEGKVKVDRAVAARKEIIEARDNIERGFLDLAELLSEAYHKEFHIQWGYEPEGEKSAWVLYCERELDVHYRKAMHFIDIWDKVKSMNLPKKDVAAIGWSKMKDLAAVITEENYKEWMAKAKSMNTAQVTEAVKRVRRKDTTGVELPTITTWKLQLTEAEASVIIEAVEVAKKMTNNQNTVTALEMICQDWMLDKGVSPTRTDLDALVKYIQNAYGVTVSYEEKAEAPKKTKAEKAAKKVVEEAEVEAEPSDLDDLGADDDEDDLLAELGIVD